MLVFDIFNITFPHFPSPPGALPIDPRRGIPPWLRTPGVKDHLGKSVDPKYDISSNNSEMVTYQESLHLILMS